MPRNAGSTGSAPAFQIIGAFFISRMPRNAGSTGSAPAFQIIGAFFISIPAFQFPGDFRAAFLTALCYLSHLARLQFITHFNQITCFLILSLQTFLQLKYQYDSPFSTHPIAMTTAVVSSAVYFFAFIAALRLPRHLAFLAHHLLVSSGYIAIAALASVALPDAAAPFVFAIFGLLSAAEFILWLRRHLDLLVEEDEDEDEAELWIRRFFITVFGNFYGRRTRGLPI